MGMKAGSSDHENQLLHATAKFSVIIIVHLRAANYIKLVAKGHIVFSLDS